MTRSGTPTNSVPRSEANESEIIEDVDYTSGHGGHDNHEETTANDDFDDFAEGGDDAKLFAQDLYKAYVKMFSRFG